MHKITVYVIEIGNEYSLKEKQLEIESALDDNLVHFGECETADIGEWHDDHTLNFCDLPEEVFEGYFKPEEHPQEYTTPLTPPKDTFTVFPYESNESINGGGL